MLLFWNSWGWGKVAHGLEHLCATSMSLGSISNPEPTCQTESNPKIYKYILKCQLITCCFSALPFPLEGSLRSAQGTLRWSAFTALLFLTVWGATWSSSKLEPQKCYFMFSKAKVVWKAGLGVQDAAQLVECLSRLRPRAPPSVLQVLHILVHSGRWRQEHSRIKTRKGKY